MYQCLVFESTVRREHYFRVKDSNKCIKYNPTVQTLSLVPQVPEVKSVTYRYMGLYDNHHVYLDESTWSWYQMVISGHFNGEQNKKD